MASIFLFKKRSKLLSFFTSGIGIFTTISTLDFLKNKYNEHKKNKTKIGKINKITEFEANHQNYKDISTKKLWTKLHNKKSDQFLNLPN